MFTASPRATISSSVSTLSDITSLSAHSMMEYYEEKKLLKRREENRRRQEEEFNLYRERERVIAEEKARKENEKSELQKLIAHYYKKA